MNEQFDPNAGPLRPRDEDNIRPIENPRTNNEARPKSQTNGHAPAGVDLWSIADLLVRRWHWAVIGCILGAAAFFELSWVLLKPKFTATTDLLRYETPATSDAMRTTPLTPETFAGLIASPDLLRRVGAQVDPPIPPEVFIKQMKVDLQPDSDIVKIFVAARSPQQAVDLANLYSVETVAFTKELQARQAAEVGNNYLKKQVAEMDQDIAALQEQFRALPTSGRVTNKLAQISGDLNALSQNLKASPRPSLLIARLSEKLQTSLADLTDLTSKYTDANPLVQQKRAQIDSIKGQISDAYTNNVAGTGFPPELANALNVGPGGQMAGPDYDIIQAKLRSLEDSRVAMANRHREAQLYAANPPGIVRVFAPATLKTVQSNHRRFKIGFLTIFGGFLGMGTSLMMVLMAEAVDSRLKTAADLRRVTRLPVLTTLGHLNRMADGSRAQWAFRTWTLLQGRLSHSQNHGLVCGITSSVEGEGRSTWINLLAEAASLSGFRVLTIATQRPDDPIDSAHEFNETLFDPLIKANGHMDHPTALTSNVLASPAQVADQLTDPNSQPVVHIPLPGWVWNLERRKQWRDALEHWRRIDNLVIFVELPPASVPEAVLLGSNLPNLLWLADSEMAEAGETRTQLETLRHARCNLVGAVLNRESARPIRRRFSRWLSALAFLAALNWCGASAQETNLPSFAESPLAVEPDASVQRVAEQATNLTLSVVNPAQRASWQNRLTLGPGDVLTFGVYGEPLLTRIEVAVGPDGRVTYLEAQDVMATGLTVDELRERVDEELAKYRRGPRTIITPVAYRSKKYFVLGKVVQRGVYTLDRPTTVIEALARAHGLENGLVENSTIDLADLSRSFLMRGGKRISLNFEKLFQNGDLTQNVQIEPGDYLYFPSANIKMVYVLGEVSLPGQVTYRPDLTAVAAITSRGGFNQKAYKSKVLVVRGSLNQPETFIVNVMDVVNGRAPDFKLQPKDIVYVTHRPFLRVEELLDLAFTAFIQASIATATGVDGINISFPNY